MRTRVLKKISSSSLRCWCSSWRRSRSTRSEAFIRTSSETVISAGRPSRITVMRLERETSQLVKA